MRSWIGTSTALVFLLAACTGPQNKPTPDKAPDKEPDMAKVAEPDMSKAPAEDMTKPAEDMAKAEPDATPEPPAPKVDHRPYHAMLQAYVDPATGLVDYAGWKEKLEDFDAYLKVLAEAPLAELSPDETYALYVNAYNAYTVRLILEKYPKISSIRKLKKPWKTVRWVVGGEKLSLDQMEHEKLRKVFKDPRIHFAVNCASIGCPPLRNEAYMPETLETQLEANTKDALTQEKYVQVKKNRLYLSQIFDWYKKDFVDPEFKGSEKTVAAYVARYANEDVKTFIDKRRGKPSVRYLNYDWALNKQKKK